MSSTHLQDTTREGEHFHLCTFSETFGITELFCNTIVTAYHNQTKVLSALFRMHDLTDVYRQLVLVAVIDAIVQVCHLSETQLNCLTGILL